MIYFQNLRDGTKESFPSLNNAEKHIKKTWKHAIIDDKNEDYILQQNKLYVYDLDETVIGYLSNG